jgi:hypothetical protein
MPSDYLDDLGAEITEKMQELRRLSDEDLMTLHLKLTQGQTESELSPTGELRSSEPDQPALQAAAYNESRRRYVSSGWIWKRLFNSGRYERWKQHFEQTEDLAEEYVAAIIARTERYQSPDDDEA